jgi:transcriptional regulator of acetoin/glycerol metabolism
VAEGGRIPGRYLADLPATIARLRRAWETYQTGGIGELKVRPVIARSWERSAAQGISPDRRAADLDISALAGFQPLDSVARALRRAAAPVLSELERELQSTNSAVVLCDEFGAILDRAGDHSILRRTERQNFVPGALWNEQCVGTNGIGLALALGRPAQVLAGEHFCVGFQDYVCSAAPVRHPVTRAVVGLVDVTSDARDASGLAHALVVQAAGTVERRMQEELLGRERSLLELYLRGRVARSTPLLTVDRAGRTLIQNAPAAEQLETSDVGAALALAREALQRGSDLCEVLSFTRGSSKVEVRLARSGGEVIGAVIAVSGIRRATRDRRQQEDWGPLVARSPGMQRLLREAARAVGQDTPLLIEGPPGAGKLTLARELHRRSPSASRPLALVSAARRSWREDWRQAVKQGAGTIVLRRLSVLGELEQLELAEEIDILWSSDEPGTSGSQAGDAGTSFARATPPSATAVGKPRLISLLTVEEPRLRQELRDRIGAGGKLSVPALCQRTADLDGLVRVWCARRRQRGLPDVQIGVQARAALMQHSWLGNVRELFAVLDAGALRHTGQLRAGDLPLEPPCDGTGGSLRDRERTAILDALERCGGNAARTAEMLGISRATLYRRLQAYRTLHPPGGVTPSR